MFLQPRFKHVWPVSIHQIAGTLQNATLWKHERIENGRAAVFEVASEIVVFKCKALTVTLQRNVLDNLPFNHYHYMLGESFIEYEESQRDLGVIIHNKLLWASHANNLTSIARSKLGLLMRTCHFTTNKRLKGSFYLTIVGSLFEHCSVILALS